MTELEMAIFVGVTFGAGLSVSYYVIFNTIQKIIKRRGEDE